ncbi:hypothetical protein ACFSHR_00290 [Azotobacter chroococcum]
MTEEFFEYDPAKALDCAEAVEIFIADALETGDADYIVKAMRVVARARGMAQEADPEGAIQRQVMRMMLPYQKVIPGNKRGSHGDFDQNRR